MNTNQESTDNNIRNIQSDNNLYILSFSCQVHDCFAVHGPVRRMLLRWTSGSAP